MKKFKAIIAIILTMAIVLSQTTLAQATERNPDTTNGNELPADYVDNSNEGLYEILTSLLEEEQSLFSPLSASAPKAEIVFVIDSTGSMQDYITNVKENIVEFAQDLSAKSVNLRLGVVEYKDIYFDGLDSTKVHMVNRSPWMNVTNFVNTLTGISVGGGFDWPETPIDALGFLTDGKTMMWSSDSYKFAFLLTDAPYEIDNRHGYESLSEVAGDLKNMNIHTSVITMPSLYSTYNALTLRTGGINADISSSDFSDVMKDYAESVTGVINSNKKVIYMLPGYMGSQLYDSQDDNAKTLWLDLHFQAWGLIGGVPGFLASYEQRQHDAFINENSNGRHNDKFFAFSSDLEYFGVRGKDSYGANDTYETIMKRLKNEFEGEFDVKFFAYNWLGCINDAVIEIEQDAQNYDEIYFVTHSTGALVAAAYIEKSRENARKVQASVLITPPLLGTYAALLPLELGQQKTGLFRGITELDIILNNNWARRIVHNSPTTYQLLPNRDYFRTTHALDLRIERSGFLRTESWINNALWHEFYGVVPNSGNVNGNLLSNVFFYRSHRYFRENSLNETENRNIIDTFLSVKNSTVIAVPHGLKTPMTARYCIADGRANARFIDVKYNKAGDGTVYHTSTGLTLNESNDVTGTRLNSRRFFGEHGDANGIIDHSSILEVTEALNLVVDLINQAADRDSFSPFSTGAFNSNIGTMSNDFAAIPPPDETMESSVKLRIESDKEVEIKIYDGDDELVAFNEPEYVIMSEEHDFIWNEFGDEGETLTSIYLPNSGYKVSFHYGSAAATPIEFTVLVNLLDADGDITGFGSYYSDATIAGGEIFTLDMISGVTSANIRNLLSSPAYPAVEIDTEMFATWEDFDFSGVNKNNDVIVLADIGDEAVLGIIGTIDPKDISWASSDSTVVSVDDGKLVATGYGRVVITASATDGSGKSMIVHVKVSLSASSVSFEYVDLFVGERAIIYPEYNDSRVTENWIDYTFDTNSGIIDISDGVIVALSSGTIEVTGTAFGGAKSTFNVNVTNDTIIPVQGVTISSEKTNVTIGRQVTLTAIFTPDDATNQEVNWFIEDESIVEIIKEEDNTFVLNGLNEGSTEITVVTADGGYFDIITITVTAHPPTGLPDVTLYTVATSVFLVTSIGIGGYLLRRRLIRKRP